MLIERKINGVEMEIDPTESNLIYFDADFEELLEDYTMSDITNNLIRHKTYSPISVTVELTNACNFSCKFCYINESSSTPHFWDYDKLISIFDILIEKGMLFCTLTGGECMLHPRFKDIYMYLKERGVLVSVFTNLNLLNDEIIEMFDKFPPYKVEVSIYGMTQEDYDRVMDKDYGEINVLQNILKLKDIGINILCKTPVNSLTQDAFFNIKEFVEKNNLEFLYSSELFDSYSGEDRQKYVVIDKTIINMLNKRESDITKYNMDKEVKARYAFDCKAGKSSLCISASERIAPCLAFNDLPFYTYDISNNFLEGYNNMLNFILTMKGKKLTFCNGCYKHKACTECIYTQLKYSENLKEYMNTVCSLI